MNLKPTSIKVAILFPEPGTEQRNGWVFDKCPGLAITPTMYWDREKQENEPSGFSVTHLESGAFLAHCLPTVDHAAEVMETISPLTDWTQTGEALKALPGFRDIEAQIVEIARRVHLRRPA